MREFPANYPLFLAAALGIGWISVIRGDAYAEDPFGKTSLRIIEIPQARLVMSRKRSTLSMSALVRNAGEAKAEGVRVVAKLPDGTTIRMRGPAALVPVEKAKYSVAKRNLFPNPHNIRFLVSCDNCRNSVEGAAGM